MILDLSAQYREAKKRLFLLDYDGTLVGFKPTPPQAKPGTRLLKVLNRLTEDKQNTVVIISGRDKGTLETWLGGLQVTLIAEHGQFTKLPGQPWQALAPVNDAWKKDVERVMGKSVLAVPDSFIEEKATSLVWHNRTSDLNVAQTESPKLLGSLKSLIKIHGLTLLEGKRNIEARVGGFTKGTAGILWLKKQSWDFILAAGDDATDEDLFKAMPPAAYTIKIGAGETTASNRMASPQVFVKLLDTLTT